MTDSLQTAITKDLSPQSFEHVVRLIFAFVLVGGGVYFLVTHGHTDWDTQDVVVLGMCFLLGAGVAFTSSVVTLLKALVGIAPWTTKTTDSVPPPPPPPPPAPTA